MRRMLRQAVSQAADALQAVKPTISNRNLTEAEQLERYVSRHRGQPRAMMDFAQRTAPEGQSPLEAAAAYEEAMEAKLAAARAEEW